MHVELMYDVSNELLFIAFKLTSDQAGLQPWEGINAQDAVTLSYNAISMLRQQMRPDLRVHGVVHYDKTQLPVNGELLIY